MSRGPVVRDELSGHELSAGVKKSTESRTCHRRKPDLRVGHNFEIVFFRQVAFLHLGRKNSSRSKVSIEIRKEFASELFF